MNRKTDQHQYSWDYFKNQLYEFHLEKFGNDATCWQDFHQASIICRTDKNSLAGFQRGFEGIKKLQNALVSDSHQSLKLIPLLEASKLDKSVSEAILERGSCRKNMIAKPLPFQDLSDLLYYGYGKKSNGLKNIPSGGALYPLEVYIYCADVESIAPGLYYYSSEQYGLKRITGERTQAELKSLFSDEQIYNIVKNASVYIFITASFLKTTWKYSERGYRFALIEAGHLAQNINLIAAAEHLACLNIGGFYDLETNQFLGLDGVLDANLYMICLAATNTMPIFNSPAQAVPT